MATTRSRIREKRNSTTETTKVRRRIQYSSSLRRKSNASAPNAGKKIRIERRCPLSSISVPLRKAPDAESAKRRCRVPQSRRPPPTPRNSACYLTACGEAYRRPPLRHRLHRSPPRQSSRHPQLSKVHSSRATSVGEQSRPHTVRPRSICCRAVCARLPTCRVLPSSSTSARPPASPPLRPRLLRSKACAPAIAPLLRHPLHPQIGRAH